MTEAAVPELLVPFDAEAIPGLVSFWFFRTSSDAFCAQHGEPYVLRSQAGPLEVVDDPGAPFGGKALLLEEGRWLSIPRAECPGLDIHGRDGHVTLVAWIRRERTAHGGCEFIAGQWNETRRQRQYGLFLHLGNWGRLGNRICAHISNVGGPTPGYKYCMDGGMGATEIPFDEWVVVGLSYDGQAGSAWLHGGVDFRPGLNPYPLAGGLYDGGPDR